MNFTISKDFMLDGKPIKLISGALHYFRICPLYWQDRLEKLKNMGCNCVETYIPWNFHEPKEGQFEFENEKDVARFVHLAADLGLLVILRPTPYICAEWEFGGLPAWLLKDDAMRVRSTYKPFLEKVDKYYEALFKVIRPLLFTNGGPVIMCQIENEYGSFGNDKKYLKAIKDLMIKHGCDVPLFTSDGGWREVLDAGTLLNEDVLATANFGSRTDEQMGALKTFMQDNNIEAPLMCMEFWIGWFNNWGSPIKKRDASDAAYELDNILQMGSVNIYMFCGGTNYGFYNGCSYHGMIDPQTTSYDYDAPLTEWGMPSEKYYKFKEVISKYRPIDEVKLSANISFIDYGDIRCTNAVSLFNTLHSLAKPIYNDHTLAMEKLDQNFGYILYRANVGKKRHLAKSKLVDCDDRALVFVNQKLVATQYRENMGTNIELDLPNEDNNILDILVENVGRINYGASLVLGSMRKGLKGGYMLDLHFHTGWQHYCLELDNIDDVDFDQKYEANGPAFYEYKFNVDTIGDTFLNLDGFGKGCAFINGKNIGRFYNEGPINYLYISAPLLHRGENRIIIFETEGIVNDHISLNDKPLIKE